MKKGLGELHKCLLKMAKDFHELCQEHDLQYYIIGGTFLGAVRHQGFIPWDDDMDIGMPRESYERFLKLPKEAFPSHFIRMDKGYNKDHGDYPFIKLCNKKTTLVEDINEYRVEGVFIDIFPLDGAHNSKLLSKLKFKLSRFYIYALWYNGSEKDHKSLNEKIKVFVSKKFNNRKIYSAFNRMLSKTSYDKSKYAGNFMGVWGYKEIMPKSYLGKPTLYKFEDTELFGPENKHEFLKQVYGDYMKMPPIEKQASHHLHEYLDLDLPFEEYYRLTQEQPLYDVEFDCMSAGTIGK